jgi:hypothetical protein
LLVKNTNNGGEKSEIFNLNLELASPDEV